MKFHNIRTPRTGTPLAEMVVGSTQIDLHSKLQFIGLTLGADDGMMTLGWAVIAEVLVVRGAQVLPLDGLALQFSGLTRIEMSFTAKEPGALEYYELEAGREGALRLHFEGGTMRIVARECRGELLFGEEAEEPDGQDGPLSIQ